MACCSVGGGDFFQHFWRHTEILNDLCNLFPPPSLLFPPPGGGRWRICSHNLPHWSRHTQLFRWIREKVDLKPRSAQDRGLTSWPGLSRASHPRSLVVGPRSALIDNCFHLNWWSRSLLGPQPLWRVQHPLQPISQPTNPSLCLEIFEKLRHKMFFTRSVLAMQLPASLLMMGKQLKTFAS